MSELTDIVFAVALPVFSVYLVTFLGGIHREPGGTLLPDPITLILIAIVLDFAVFPVLFSIQGGIPQPDALVILFALFISHFAMLIATVFVTRYEVSPALVYRRRVMSLLGFAAVFTNGMSLLLNVGGIGAL